MTRCVETTRSELGVVPRHRRRGNSRSVGLGQPLPFRIDHLRLPFAQRQDNGPVRPLSRMTTFDKRCIVSFG